MKRKTKLIKGIVNIITLTLAFTYAVSLTQGQIAWMQGKSIFLQIMPMLIALVICAFCEDWKEGGI